MALPTRRKSEAKVTGASIIDTNNTVTTTTPSLRPDPSRIHIDTAILPPSSQPTQPHPHSENDQLIYSSSTPSKSVPTSTTTFTTNSTLSNPQPSNPDLTTTQTMSKFTILPQPDEDDLHAKRLLNIEEKPFKRIQKRLLAPSNPIQEYLRRTATDSSPAVAENGQSSNEDTTPSSLETFHHSTLHDFSALSTSLARLQFLLTSNTRERARYATQATSITAQHSTIKANTSALRTRLTDAKDQLAVRKTYDTLAERVLWIDGVVGGERAKTREELGRESEKLRSEIEELEREGEELKSQWGDRREALDGVIAEAGRLKRVVRGEPEVSEEQDEAGSGVEDADGVSEAEDGEGVEKRRDYEEEAANILGVDGAADESSNMGTPRPVDDGGATPLPDTATGGTGGFTPLPAVHESETSGGMTPRSMGGESGATPRPLTADGGSALKTELKMESEDAEMADSAEQTEHVSAGIPELKVDEADKAEASDMDTT